LETTLGKSCSSISKTYSSVPPSFAAPRLSKQFNRYRQSRPQEGDQDGDKGPHGTITATKFGAINYLIHLADGVSIVAANLMPFGTSERCISS
jgi:hypothetical protein